MTTAIPYLCEAAPNFLSSFVTAVAHGGNPQDRAASPLRPLRFVPNKFGASLYRIGITFRICGYTNKVRLRGLENNQ
ncbi:hypothetical protein [Nostoc sp.]|uniref:hypothetical protein n=1 Tax=Nostoc sp. TaxID=1180 RepID=UPI002FFB3039